MKRVRQLTQAVADAVDDDAEGELAYIFNKQLLCMAAPREGKASPPWLRYVMHVPGSGLEPPRTLTHDAWSDGADFALGQVVRCKGSSAVKLVLSAVPQAMAVAFKAAHRLPPLASAEPIRFKSLDELLQSELVGHGDRVSFAAQLSRTQHRGRVRAAHGESAVDVTDVTAEPGALDKQGRLVERLTPSSGWFELTAIAIKEDASPLYKRRRFYFDVHSTAQALDRAPRPAPAGRLLLESHVPGTSIRLSRCRVTRLSVFATAKENVPWDAVESLPLARFAEALVDASTATWRDCLVTVCDAAAQHSADVLVPSRRVPELLPFCRPADLCSPSPSDVVGAYCCVCQVAAALLHGNTQLSVELLAVSGAVPFELVAVDVDDDDAPAAARAAQERVDF